MDAERASLRHGATGRSVVPAVTLLFVYVIVGGKNSVWGPLLGTFFLFCVPEIIKITPETELVVFGALMMIVGGWMPGGIAGGLQALGRFRSQI
jgi:ABC-type branched-subunit amino acid transport system permease subunit